ncbi:MAG: hypothetical protein GWP16_01460 [Nitrospirae bacterium]|nr:hypothetical protein [Nitrospirota bacterium]
MRQPGSLRQIAEDLRDAPVGRLAALPLRLPGALRAFFATTLDRPAALQAVERSLRSREDRFLDIVRDQVFGRPDSPYLRLFRHAGCDLIDLRASLESSGLEDTLSRLAEEGVYLSADEFKGKSPVKRGQLSFDVSPRDFEPRRPSLGLPTESSGSSNRPFRSLSSLDWLGQESPITTLFLAAHGLERHAHAAVDVILPGGAGMLFLLMVAKSGIAPEKWFCRTAHTGWVERRYQASIARQVMRGARRYGPGFPVAEPVDYRDLRPVVQWVARRAEAGAQCCIRCVGSNAVKIAKAALGMGVSLSPVTFVVSGEPFTDSKRAVVESAGAGFTVQYGYTPGAVHVSRGCARRRVTDDMHVDLTTLAVVEHSRIVDGDALSVLPLLFTTLHPSAAVLQINVENGDHAVLERNRCGCDLGEAGFDLHIHHVRSFEKFTCQGMNYAFTDLYELVEGRLPAKFGGGPGDYQLVEDGQDGGDVLLVLRVAPGLGDLDEGAVLRELERGLSASSRNQRFMARIWQEAGVLKVRREPPQVSERGKVLPLLVAPGPREVGLRPATSRSSRGVDP